MAEDEAREKPLSGIKDRIQEKVREFIDELAETLDSILTPEPEPIPIPVRKRW